MHWMICYKAFVGMSGRRTLGCLCLKWFYHTTAFFGMHFEKLTGIYFVVIQTHWDVIWKNIIIGVVDRKINGCRIWREDSLCQEASWISMDAYSGFNWEVKVKMGNVVEESKFKNDYFCKSIYVW